jgi:6-phosphogluconolactonase (cycloisomerase 2 family)
MSKIFKLLVATALALTLHGRASADATTGAEAELTVRTARWALTANRSADLVSVYSIASDTGALTLHAKVPTGVDPHALAVHPSGRFVYVISGAERHIETFRFDPATGTLAAAGSTPMPEATCNPFSVGVEPLGRFAYATCLGSNTIAGFWVNPFNGALKALPGAPIATGAAPHEIVFGRFGREAFVTNFVAGTVSAYRIGLTGRLIPVDGSPFQTLPRPEGLAIDPRGHFVYAVHSDGGGVSAFKVGPRGVLTAVPGSPFAAGLDPFGVATSADGKTLYISEPLFEQVLFRRIDTATGAISDLPPSRVAAGNNVRRMEVDRSGKFVYVTGIIPSAIYAYAIDATGVLTPLPGSPIEAEPGLSDIALVR